jgi:hypothetical protein
MCSLQVSWWMSGDWVDNDRQFSSEKEDSCDVEDSGDTANVNNHCWRGGQPSPQRGGNKREHNANKGRQGRWEKGGEIGQRGIGHSVFPGLPTRGPKAEGAKPENSSFLGLRGRQQPHDRSTQGHPLPETRRRDDSRIIQLIE